MKNNSKFKTYDIDDEQGNCSWEIDAVKISHRVYEIFDVRIRKLADDGKFIVEKSDEEAIPYRIMVKFEREIFDY